MPIRPYTAADWDAVRTIYDLSKPDEMRGAVDLLAIVPLADNSAYLALFRESSIMVMEESNAIVAFAGHRDNYVAWVYVHPAHRRKGFATALVRALLERLDGRVTLHVGKHNGAARSLYQRLGFVVVNESVRDFNGHPVDTLTLSYGTE